ncbi:hypothetical protein [Bacillus atrophaeus]|uniref:hypothetical protein n=1 Tax=Bacillus atrophaeus TaxID=1452 RepID=UPI002E1CEF3A|nr:hypothetical protein [Bacillus atrophaeus]MED4823218.1 hypothetical protein [Bacillus atrophaeus]MED4842768.1 hypothetical protein [Bacillus atrophaeus]MED4854749.1 hypothetical protein [Bacillus atrophaeus]
MTTLILHLLLKHTMIECLFGLFQADADGGNQICLGIKGEGSGNLYFWDHELTNRVKDNLLIADSFEDFIQSLFVEEDSDEEDVGILFIELDDDLLNS